MQFTIISQPSKYDPNAMNYFLIRTKDGASVGMVEEEAVDDLMRLFKFESDLKEVAVSIAASSQLSIPFEDE